MEQPRIFLAPYYRLHFTSYLPTFSLQVNDVGTTDTKPYIGHKSSRKKFFPTWGVPGIAKRDSGSAH